MDTYIKEVVDYLLYIGILPKSAISNFNNLYISFLTRYDSNILSERNYNSNGFKKANSSSLIFSPNINYDEYIIQTLSTYIMSLTTTQIKNMCTSIIQNFFKNKTKVKGKLIINLFNIYSNKRLKKYFNFWKNKKKKNTENYNFEYNTVRNPFIKYNILKNSINQKRKSNISKSFISESLNRTKNKFKKNSTIVYNSLNNSSNFSQSFIKRQNEYTKKVQENKEKVKNKSEEELRLLCSFSPQLNVNTLNVKSRYNNNSSIHSQKSFSQKNEKKTLNQVKSFNNLTSAVTERLYNDFNKYKQKKKDLQKTIDNERGITFKPKSFTQNSGYFVESNFGDRNKKLLENRQNFAFVFDYLRQKKMIEDSIGGGFTNQLLFNYLHGNNNKNNINYNDLLSQDDE